MDETAENRLGLDFGKVILGALRGGEDDTPFLGTSFEEAMESPPSESAIDSVAKLVQRFDGRVWIVSKCGPSVEKKTRGWLDHHRFYEQTGLRRQNLEFCRQRIDKAAICQRLGITHFVDDRLDVLMPMVGIVANLYLFGEQPDGLETPDDAVAVKDWDAVLREFDA